MGLTLHQLTESLLCCAAFAFLLLPAGYLATQLLLPVDDRRSTPELACWTLVLSLPAAVVFVELLGRVLPPSGVFCFFGALAVLAPALWLTRTLTRRRSSQALPGKPVSTDRMHIWLFIAATVCGAAFILLWLVDVQRGDRLFVPTVIADWSVRVPLVRAAMAGHVPPANPLSALDGSPTPLRYYYFWYVLCGYAARLVGVSAKAALSASAVWAWFALLGALCLALKHLAGLRGSRPALFSLLPLAVMGLDLLPTLGIVISGHGHQHLDLEWWRNDRTPGFLTTLLFAPHHIAGLASCIAALCVITRLQSRTHPEQTSWRPFAGPSILVAVIFAACAGTSTFMAFVFGLVGLVVLIDAVRKKQFRIAGTLAAAALLAWLLSRPFLAELSHGNSAAKGFASFAWRYNTFLTIFTDRVHLLAAHPLLAFFVRQPAILLLEFAELGFFAFVLVDRFRHELLPAFRAQRKLAPGERLLWITFAVAAAAALGLSSSVTQAPNDLGMHAGMIVRFVLVVWSVPWLADAWQQRTSWRTLSTMRRLYVTAALFCMLCGVGGTVWNLGLVRFYLPLVESGKIRGPMDIMQPNALSQRMSSIQSAWRSLDTLPADARVQFNPTGALQPAFAYFSTRQIVASDSGCGTSFGGNFLECAPVSSTLHRLYGTSATVEMVKNLPVYRPSGYVATATDFAEVCRSLRLNAVMVESDDNVWKQRASWVWTLPPLFAGDTVRVFACSTHS